MASSSNAKDLNAEDFAEEDDEEYVPSSDESTEFSDDDFGSDMSGVSVDPDENEYVPSTMDKTLVDPFLNDLVQDEMNLPEISSNDEEWSPLNEYNDKGDSEDEEMGVQFITNIRVFLKLFDAMKRGKDSWKTEVGPRILQKMKKWHSNMRNWIVFPSGPVLETVPPMKEKKPPGRPKNPNSEERRKRKKASETSGGKGKTASETRQNVGEQGVSPMQFPESQVDEGVPLTQEGVSETQDTMHETQETVPETQFKQVPVVDVALVEDGNMEDQGHVPQASLLSSAVPDSP
ncbi:hypothetical protein L2E82_32258 [Cichorium intybus]|uniref:Uncharacterized protein n=1 Tax=Cichorium intybus TaxID=13427 RepID=A0ACB9BFH7_CICIN|nr:hypothetical protein L2E82_32258 [Cichorium intybus]